MKNKVLNALIKYNMLDGCSRVVTAVSGGADSVAMTHCLHELSSELGFSLTACHINHTLRGNESERDYRFVEEFCKALDIPLVVFREDIAKMARNSSQSIETAARNCRYMRFAQCAPHESDRIATAHTLDDRAETLIYNMIRGSGLKGIASIPPVRGNIIRPLIDCTRDDVERYCDENGLSFVTDSTNLTDDYTRNKIRHNIIPVLKDISPSALDNMKKLMETAREDSEFLENTALSAVRADSMGRYSLDEIRAQPTAVKKRIVGRALREYGFECSNFRINEVCAGVESGDFKAEYSKNKYICCRRGKLFYIDDTDVCGEFCTAIEPFKKYNIAGKNILISVYTKEQFKNLRINHKIDLKSFIDYDKIIGKVYLRQKRDGDSIKLWGRNGTKSLKKLFNEAGLTKSQKSRTLIMCDECGIIWAESFGADERVHADKNTENILLIESVNSSEEKHNEK